MQSPPNANSTETADQMTKVNVIDRKRYRELAEQFPRLPVQPGIWEILENWWKNRKENNSIEKTTIEEQTLSNEQVSSLLEPLLQEREEIQLQVVQSIEIEIGEKKRPEIDINAELVGYFQSLNTTLLRHLRFLLSEQETDRDGTTHLRSEHLEELGLHPRDDARFVERLCSSYFPEFGQVCVVPEPTLTERLLSRVNTEGRGRSTPLLNETGE